MHRFLTKMIPKHKLTKENLIMMSKKFIKLIHSRYLNHIIAGITIFCMAIPLFCGYDFSFLRTTPFTNAVISSQAQISYIAFLVSTIPLLIDTLLDFSLIFTNDKEREVFLFKSTISINKFFNKYTIS